MKPTIPYITAKFQEFNQLCFEGKLPMLPISLSRSRRTLGMVVYHRERLRNGCYRYYDFELKISNLIDRDERVIEDTILHEMIHYYIMYHQINDSSAHGEHFQWWMNTINRRFNRSITITHRSSAQEKDADTQRRHHLVCVIHFRRNTCGVMVVPRTRIFDQWDAPKEFSDTIDYQWFVTVDPFFNRFPRSMSVKAYRISPEEAETHLKGAVRLERIGKTIRAVRDN